MVACYLAVFSCVWLLTLIVLYIFMILLFFVFEFLQILRNKIL